MNLLKKLTAVDSVSGNENAIRETIIEEIKDCCDEYTTDAMGNLIAHKKGSGARVMLAAHMDEIGVMVTYGYYNLVVCDYADRYSGERQASVLLVLHRDTQDR